MLSLSLGLRPFYFTGKETEDPGGPLALDCFLIRLQSEGSKGT